MAAVQTHKRKKLFYKHIAVPSQHGSWAMWLGPYFVGLGVAGQWNFRTFYVTLVILGIFLLVQPLTELTKMLSGRKSKALIRPAYFWAVIYTVPLSLGGAGLLVSGLGNMAWLGAVALPMLAWYLWSVAKRAERGNLFGEIVWTGALAMAAPAVYWVGGGDASTGWRLWLLCWMQSASAIVYIYQKLKYRRMKELPSWPLRWRMSQASLAFHLVNLAIVAALAVQGWFPAASWIAFGVMLAEAVYGGLISPGPGTRPIVIGFRQVGITVVFTLLLVMAF